MCLVRRGGDVLLLAVLFSVAVGAAENWTRFRGPNGSGISNATNLPIEFGPDKNVLWKTPLPPGHSSPVFTNSRILLTAHSPDKEAHKQFVISFDPKTGNVLKQGRLKGAIDKYFASPIGADGKVWLASQDGTVSVVSNKAEWEILAVNTLDDEVFATPAPADGELFVRTRSALFSFSTSH
ncbi:MAG: hypothetical protein ACRD96_27845 [Bryobacteraceae bacterium]